MRKLLVNQK